MDGFNIRLIKDEFKEVRWVELQLLEGVDARLPHSQGSDRSDWDRKPSRRIQIERMVEAGQNRPRHDLDALVGVGVLHSAVVLDSLRTMEDIVGHLWEESCRDKDISDPAPLQLADERIWFGPNTPEWIRKSKLLDLGSGDDNWGWMN